MRLTDEQQHRYRQRLLAQWQDGVVAGQMLAINYVAKQPGISDELVTNLRDTLIKFVTDIADDLPLDAYEFEVVDA